MDTNPPPDFKSIIEARYTSMADFRATDDILQDGDRRDGRLYQYAPDLKLAIRVAIAVGRPLLVFGPSGCGKSSMVFNLARLMGRRYYEFVVQSRTEAKELYYKFDAIRRLGEAHLGAASLSDGGQQDAAWLDPRRFVEPGPLWWAFNAKTARNRGLADANPESFPIAKDPGKQPDGHDNNTTPAILLIDEIDKADIDFPNNLLVPLGSRQFMVEETGDTITLEAGSTAERPLIVITSNRERELPDAFVRRCVVIELTPPTEADLMALAKTTFRTDDDAKVSEWERILTLLQSIHGANPVSPAEFLDTIQAIQKLGVDEPEWKEVILKTTWSRSS